MKEIGGYLGLEQFGGQEYHPQAIALNSARNALLYVLQGRKISKLFIPYYLCDSVSRVCEDYGFVYEHYNISSDFLPEFSEKMKTGEYIYVVNFFGQITNNKAREIKKKYGNMIFDNVHAFFQPPLSGVDVLYSCRKFFGVSDGAYLYTSIKETENLTQDISKDRMMHILGRFEKTGSEYYKFFLENERVIDEMPLLRMSKLTHNILRGIDYDMVRKRRNENYNYLKDALHSHNALKLSAPDGPYAYPYYHPNGMTLKKRLAEKKIYVPTLWPNVLSLRQALEKDYTENILPLPCDQRYCIEDMRRIVCELYENGGVG